MFLEKKRTSKPCLDTKGYFPSSEHVKPLGVKFDNKLKFETHMKELCQKLNQKCMHLELRSSLGE